MLTQTKEQLFADEFDCELYRLLGKAEIKKISPEWRKVAEHLRNARAVVRTMMHPKDRAGTI